MASAKPGTRIYVEFAYGKFILPEGTSADAMAILANAIPVETEYGGGKHHIHPSCEGKNIEIKIISSDVIETLIDVRGDEHQDYDIIFDEVKSALANKKDHGVVIFGSNNIRAHNEKFEYEDMANPDFDPEDLIKKIVCAAIENPVRI